MTEPKQILALNAGSSSLKYRLFRMGPAQAEVLADDTVEHVGGDEIGPAAQTAISACKSLGIDAVGHRIVHGGPQFSAPTRVTPEVLDGLRSLRDLDPLHNPAQVALIEAAQRLLPGVPQVALFDTAFHTTIPDFAALYALPWELSERLHLRRYGFHGLSHRYVSGQLLKLLGREAAGTRLIVCHLGSGASVCAVRDGKSIDTSMGLTPLEGLVMGTRSGDLDPGLLLYLLRTQKMTPESLDSLLNKDSGLKGVSGRSNDVRDLDKAAADGDARAELALAMFAYRVRKYIGAYAAALGGLDALAFTGGIGEHSASTRARICDGLSFLGLTLDPVRNQYADGHSSVLLSPDASSVQIWLIPTDEELQMAEEILAVLPN